MPGSSPCPHRRVLSLRGQDYLAVDFGAFDAGRLARLPVVLRLLLENVLRNGEGKERDQAAAAILGWLDQRSSTAEIAFLPNRVLMHDTTSTPALVDIAAMRDVVARQGGDPATLNPVLPVDVSVDHSLAVEVFGDAGAATANLAHEIRRNRERYRFLRWASASLRNVRIHPPGTGIMHTINLEQLATVVTTSEREDGRWIHPDMLLGTDSHTPMINGIGVLGWGVGGLEAQTVMFGMPTMLRVPDVIGVHLRGRLPAGVQSTDLALRVTEALRAMGVSGEFVEFYGEGVAILSAGDRAVVANMAPEYGATTGYFPIDSHTLDYLRATGRREADIERVAGYAQAMGFWLDPHAAPSYTRQLEIDLGALSPSLSGPRRPQDRHGLPEAAAALQAATGLAAAPAADGGLPAYPVALAAITSCTNTSDPQLLVTAGLLARRAREVGLRAADWVKTSLAPGSPAAARYLERAGLMPDLEAMGFAIVGYGCTTCIGNSGPLTPPIREALDQGKARPVAARPVAMLSGNRNFPGRVHPDLDLAFIMSPALVVAYAIAGDAAADLSRAPLGRGRDGREIHLRDLWPSDEEVQACLRRSQAPDDYASAFRLASANPLWEAIDAPAGELFPWADDSNYLQPPPFAALHDQSLLGRYEALPLLVVGDDITTDHISPASAIPSDSFIADYLVDRGEDRGDLNVFASRRGNWKVMMRGAFYSRSLRNLLHPDAPAGQTLHQPSGEVRPLFEVARRYREEGISTVLVAGERYGMGSSRDWAAKALRLLNVRAVLALSFERIHRSNLIGMGIVPLRLAEDLAQGPGALRSGDRVGLVLPAGALQPRQAIQVEIRRPDGGTRSVAATLAVETRLELAFLEAGGVMPAILARALAA